VVVWAPNRVLVLGAHPDDEMACSGLIARLAAGGAQVDAVAFSDCSDAIPDGFALADLKSEYARATRLLGITNAQIGEIPNRRFPEHRQDILSLLDDRRGLYDLVLVPSTTDAHQDHHTVAEEAIRALKHTTILGYDLAMNTVLESRRSCYVCLTPADLDLKVAHAQVYQTQASRPYMAEDFIRGLATVRGVQVGRTYAESYEVIRWVL
jgi:LmbE family N-acetylglucosaminyl deacetylase